MATGALVLATLSVLTAGQIAGATPPPLLTRLLTGGGSAAAPATTGVAPLLSPGGLRLMNYFPLHHFGNLWAADRSAVDADFARIASMNANTVRIFVDVDEFGFPNPRPQFMGQLSDTVGMAAAHGIRVQLTLFDGFNTWLDTKNSQHWAAAVVGPFAGDPRIAFIEVRNELDPSNMLQVYWARNLIPYVRSIAGGIPVTVSVFGSQDTSAFKQLTQQLHGIHVDLYDFHFYGPPALAVMLLQQVKGYAGSVPVVIGETGYTTDPSNNLTPGLQPTTADQEAYQDQYYRTVELATQTVGMPLAAPWTLYDLAPTDCSCPVSEQLFGLYRTDGSPKRAAASVASIFGGAPVDTSFDNGMEIDGGGLPADWRINGAGQGTFSQDSAVTHSGGRSARLQATGMGPNGGAPSLYLNPVISVVPGQAYTLKAWVSGASATGKTRLSILWLGQSSYIGQVDSAPLPTGNSSWTQLVVSGVAPSGTNMAQLHLGSMSNSGTVWFDDVSFS